MKKSYKLIDLDCANCAQKMETAINKLDGVNAATVNFLMQKLTIDADDERFDDILQQAVSCIKKVEPDCQVVLKCRGKKKRPWPASWSAARC